MTRLEAVKIDIRSVLMPYQNGLSLVKFLAEHRRLLGIRLPTREFGFTSDIDFLSSIPDVVNIVDDGYNGYHLIAVCDEKTKHIHSLVKRQRPSVATKVHKNRAPARVFKEVNLLKDDPFIPAAFREKIVSVVKQYRSGIGYCTLLKAYKRFFNHDLNLEWLSVNPGYRLKILANSIPQLELKLVENQERLFFVEGKMQSSRHFDNLDCVKLNFETILKKNPNGILAIHLPILYKEFYGKQLDMFKLGYVSFSEFIDDFPNIFYRRMDSNDKKEWIFHSSQKEKIILKNKVMAEQQTTDKHRVLLNDLTKFPSSTENTLDQVDSQQDYDCKLSFVTSKPPEELFSTFTPVFISTVSNPSDFYFQMQSAESVAVLQEFEKGLQLFYNFSDRKRLRMLNRDVLIGSSCVTYCTEDKYWYRSVIVSLPTLDSVTVLFVDFGCIEKTMRSNLYYLKQTFMNFPVHCFKGKLANIKPLNKDDTWTAEAEAEFRKFCDSISIEAQITSESDGIYSLQLSDWTDIEEGSINNVLIQKGYAEFSGGFDHYRKFRKQSNDSCDEDSAYGSPNECSATKQNDIEKDLSPVIPYSPLNVQSNKETQVCSIKKVTSEDEYTLHIIQIKDDFFVSGNELSYLLWSNKSTDYLFSKLKLKNIVISSLHISDASHAALIKECKKNNIKGFTDDEINLIEMYHLKNVITILNIFGHPSSSIRKLITIELENIYPSDAIWKVKYTEDLIEEKSIFENDNLNKLCIHDLKEMCDGLLHQRQQLILHLSGKNEGRLSYELKNLHQLHTKIIERIKQLQNICFFYADKNLKFISD